MMFAPGYTVWHCGTLKKGKKEMNTEADDWANERQSNTPRTDSATFYADTSVTVTELCVTEEFARTLERENAALRGQLQKETQRRFDGNEIASKEHREEVAALRDELTKCKVALADRDSAWRLYKEAREAEVQQASRADEAVAKRDKLVAAFAHLQSFVSGDLQEYDAAEVASLINAALKEEGK